MRFPVPTPNFALRSTRGAENGKSANGKCSTVGGSVERTGESKIVTDLAASHVPTPNECPAMLLTLGIKT